MRRVYLYGNNGKGKYAIVDAEDYDRVNKHKWYFSPRTGYATTVIHISGSHTKNNIIQENHRMHRFVLRLKNGDGSIVDHINCNRLYNTKNNLRVVSDQQNCWNKKPKGDLGVKGVTIDSDGIKFVATCAGKFLGTFTDLKTAALAHDKAARVYYGEYAYLNFPDEVLPIDIKLTHIDREPLPVNERKAKYLGVSYFGHGGKRIKRWRATYRRKNLGYFHTELEAANAYAEARGISLEDCK